MDETNVTMTYGDYKLLVVRAEQAEQHKDMLRRTLSTLRAHVRNNATDAGDTVVVEMADAVLRVTR
jgi:ribosomal protein S17